MAGAENITMMMDLNKPNNAISESRDFSEKDVLKPQNGSGKSAGKDSPAPRRTAASDQSNSSSTSHDAAVLVLQRNARGMSDRCKTRDLAASKLATENLMSTLDPMLSPTENATKLLEDLKSASNHSSTSSISSSVSY